MINIEAPRLLAHALLFEVDFVLKRRTGNNFVRWMDDINFGVADRRSASVILGEVSDVLKSRGLALNMAKTEVMTSREAMFHFMFKENLRLSALQKRAKRLKSLQARGRLGRKVGMELAKHLKVCKARNRDKATKRYLTILGTLGVPVALARAREIYAMEPSLRASVLYYLSRLPFSRSVGTTFIRLLGTTELHDDATRFGFVAAVVKWEVPRSALGQEFVDDVKIKLQKTAKTSPFDWLCLLVFLAKYGEAHEVLSVAQAAKSVGAKEPFFARQRVAVLTRGLGINRKSVLSQWRTETSTGYSDSASVATNLLHFCSDAFPAGRNRLYPYLFPTKVQKPYPLPKFLLLCALASAEAEGGGKVQRPEVGSHVRDPWYRHWIAQIHPPWF